MKKEVETVANCNGSDGSVGSSCTPIQNGETVTNCHALDFHENSVKLKDSGIPWIGAIPEHWNASKIGQLYDNRYERVSDKDFEPLSVTMQGILPQLETAAKTDDGDNRKLVKKGDFAINSRSDRRGSCGISPQDGSVSLINLILAPRTSMNADYYNWLFHTSLFADEFYSWGHGIVADLWTTRWQEMKNIAIPVPPLEEQERIAAWLDGKCGEIDELIDVEQQMISELEAYRQAVITEAVAHGLNPNVPTKSTNVVWYPQIPSHWELITVRGLSKGFRKGNGITKDDLASDGDIYCIRYGDLYTKYKHYVTDIVCKTNEAKISPAIKAEYGDIYFTCSGEDIDAIGKSIAFLSNVRCLVGGDLIIMKHHQNPKFLGYSLDSQISQKQKSVGKSKLKVVHTSVKELKNVIIPLPPFSEQQEIADYLDSKCAEIDALIKVKQEKIDTLKQYRQSLIFEAVTGKTSIN